MPRDEQVLDALAQLRAEVRAGFDRLERAIAGGKQVSHSDLALLQGLLPAIAAALGSEPFLASELSEHAGPRIASAGLSARQIGRLLKRATGVPVAGLVVERLAVEAGACVWRLVATS